MIFSALAIATVAFVGCKKDDPAEPSEPGSATISGVINADLNQNDDTLTGPIYDYLRNPEYPSGANVTFVINEGDLDYNPAPGFNYQDLSWTVPISATNGTYTVSVPAINQPVPVTMYFDEFNYDQIVYWPDTTVYDYNHAFKVNGGMPVTLTVVNGGAYVYNDTYE